MISLKTPLQRATGIASLLCALTLIPAANAGPINIATFALVNTNADGTVAIPSVLFPADSTSFDLTGGNNGIGLTGQTEFVATAATAGIVQFLWSYTSCFPPNVQSPSTACDDPGLDWAGYIVNQMLTQLADTDTNGAATSAQFAVSAGSPFGWYVGTADNEGEPGTLTVSSVSFTPVTGTPEPTPEPGTLSLCTTCVLAFAATRRSILNTLFQKRRTK
jgi:hypothetical protein